MNFTRSGRMTLAGLLLAAAAIPLLRNSRNANERSSHPSEPGPLSAKSEQRESATPGTDRPLTARTNSAPAGSLTAEHQVAIFENDGKAAALAAAKGLTGPDRDSQVLFILSYLARIDPEFVAAELAAAGLSTVHQGFVINAVMNSWEDGAKALAWASTFTGDQRKRAVGQALRILVRTDANAALAFLEAMPESGSRSQALCDLFASWGGHDPRAALACLENHLSPEEKVSATTYVAGAWARKSPEEVIEWIGTLQDPVLSQRLIHEVAMNWSSMAPEKAAAWIATLPDGTDKAGILAAMAERERHTTRCDFAVATPPEPDQSWKNKPVAEMKAEDLRNWGYQDHEGARKYLESAPADLDLSDLTIIVAVAITSKEGPAATFEWARGLPEAHGNVALRVAMCQWVEVDDPAAAAEKFASIEPGRRGALAATLAENWSRKDPAAAAAWAATYPGPEQKTLVRDVLQRWSDLEPREAYHWLGTLPAGESRDEGISYMIRHEAPRDPGSLLPWLDLISDPKLREQKTRELKGYSERAPQSP